MAIEDLSKFKIDKSAGMPKKRGLKRYLYWATTVLAIVFLFVLYLNGVFAPTVSVSVSAVSMTYPSQSLTLLNASGYVVAQRKAAIASKTTGRLVWIGVEEGSIVKKDQVVARLESDDVASSKGQAEANLGVAKSSLKQAEAELNDSAIALKREGELLAKGYTARAGYDAADARYKKAMAAVEGARSGIKASEAVLRGASVAVEYTLIRAPFDAVVLTKNADIGDIITPLGAAANAKAAVVTIADMGSLQVEADVSESNLGKVKAGQACELQLDALPDARFRGVVHMIVPTADRSKATVMVKIRFLDRDRRILPEMSAKVAFLSRPVAAGEQKPRVTVNPSALAGRAEKKAVFVVRDGRAIEAPVVIGPQFGDFVEVLSGVKAGDKVVINPPAKLKSGTKIKIEEK